MTNLTAARPFRSIVVALLLSVAPADAQTIGGGARHSVVLTNNAVWTWGDDQNGQLADGDGISRPSPASIGISDIVAVAAGGYHTLVLTSGGQVLVSGYNTYDQLGLGADPETDDPPGPPFRTLRPVPGLTNIVAIAAGTYHSLALDASGVVYAWGYNGEGQIGDGTEISRDGPVAVFNGATAIWRRNPSLAGRRHRRAGVGVGRQQRQATLALSLVPSTGWGDGVYQTDVVLGEDAAWAYVEGVNASGFYATTLSFDPVTLTVESENTLGSAGSSRWDLRVRSAVSGGGVFLSGPTSALAVGMAGSAFGFAAGANGSYVGGGTWSGWPDGRPSAATGSVLAEALTTFASPQGGGTNAEDDPRAGIFVKAHAIAGNPVFYHTSIRMVPHNQPYWRSYPDIPNSIFTKLDSRSQPRFFATLGAAPEIAPCFGDLVSSPNRNTDVNDPPVEPTPEKLKVARRDEDSYIGRLLQREANYRNRLNKADYACDPAPFTDSYNSNSFARGPLQASDLPLPTFPRDWYAVFIPGWYKPLPKSYFEPD
jgi:hypothetical protein